MTEKDGGMDELAETVQWLRAAFRDAPASGSGTEETAEAAGALIGGHLPAAEAAAESERLLEAPARALEVRVAAAMREARAAEGLGAEAATEDDGATRVVALPKRATSQRRWLWTGLGAVAAAIIATWALRPPQLESPPDGGVRAGTDAPLASGLPDAVLSREACVLEWSGGPAAATYDLYVTTPDLVEVYQALDLRERTHRVPVEALADFASGQRLLWRVVAAGPRGRRAHSNAFEVVVE